MQLFTENYSNCEKINWNLLNFYKFKQFDAKMSEILTEESSNDVGIVIKAPVEHPRIRINRWRVREGFPVSASQVILLYEVLPPEGVEDTTTTTTNNKTIHKLKAQRVGVVKKRLFKDGATVKAE